MFLLGFLLPICFIPGITGAVIPSQWILLGVVLPCFLWRSGAVGWGWWLCLLALAYAALSTLWSQEPYHSIYSLWLVAIWVLSYRLGTTASSLAQLWKGLAIGLSISSPVAIAQHFGWEGIPQFSSNPAGLLYNSTLIAICIAIAALGLIQTRAYAYLPAMLPAFLLAHSRGGYLVLIVGLLARIHWTIAASLTIAVGTFYLLDLSSSDQLRIQIWSAALHNLSWCGNGIGSFLEIWLVQPGNIIHPEFTHNDYLQLVFELGIGAIPIFAVLAWAVAVNGPNQPILFALLISACFYFPLHCPILAFLTFLLAGRDLAGYDLILPFRIPWRSICLQGPNPQRQSLDPAWNATLSIQPSDPTRA